MRVDAFAPAEAPACHIRPYERDPRRRGSDPATRERRRGGGQRFLWDESDIVIGMLSQRGFLRAVTHHGFAAFRMSVSAVMTPAVVSCEASDSTDAVAELMRQPRIWHVPVIDRGALIGIVSIRDLLADRSSSTTNHFSLPPDATAAALGPMDERSRTANPARDQTDRHDRRTSAARSRA
jgi:CBS-domain-containing membrane protein